MESWGAARYGQPCRECAFDWTLAPLEAVAYVGLAPAEVARRVRTATGDECRPEGGWSVSEYVSHMADNLRNWAERLQGARLSGISAVAGYDPDLLAEARNYRAIPVQAATWSLQLSCRDWVPIARTALVERLVLDHASRGAQQAADIARNNCHDVAHHLWDLDQILDPH